MRVSVWDELGGDGRRIRVVRYRRYAEIQSMRWVSAAGILTVWVGEVDAFAARIVLFFEAEFGSQEVATSSALVRMSV